MVDDGLLAEAAEPRARLAAVPRVSVVVPARNAGRTIGQQLEALAKQEYEGDWELIVADNGSTDATTQIVDSFAVRFESLRLVDAGTTPGINRARNAGIRSARGDVILFCDADDLVAPGWVSGLAHGLDEYDAAGGAIDVKSLNRDSPSGLRAPPPADCLPMHVDFLPRAQGANMGVRRNVLESLGGFDEEFEFGSDEAEFFWRLQLEGFSLGFVRDAVVHYRYPGSIRAGVRQLYRYGRSHPQLYRAFRHRGMQRSSGSEVLRKWAWVVLHLPDVVRGSRRRLRWIGRATLCFGRIAGSVRHRVVYF